ncbi:MAG: glutamate mutase L [Chloroflexi bacterium]|nr:glutamate mutase L [Chloroflexota bacterium]
MTSTAAALVDVAHGRPLRVATLAAHPGSMERATLRALLAAGVEVVIAMGARDPRSFGERAQALRDARPHVVVIALADRGETDHLALLAEALRFGCAAQRPAPRILVASSDDGAVARATALATPFAAEVVPDLRTDDGRRRVVTRLRALRREGGLLRDEALETLARRIAEVRRSPALVVDVTSSSTSLVRAEPLVPLLAAHGRPLGVGRGADHVVARAGLERVRRWIPWTVDQPTLLERVFNRARWPDAVPTDRESLALEIALAHEALAHLLADAAAAGLGAPLRTAATILLTGRLAALPGAEHALLIAIDALEPTEPASIARDEGDALLALASAVASDDHAPLDAKIGDGVVPAAGVIPVTTSRRSLVRIASAGSTREERVDRGSFFVLPVGDAVEVSGPGVTRARIACGPLGLVVDARPRPLALPVRDAERVPAVSRWYETLGVLAPEVAAR